MGERVARGIGEYVRKGVVAHPPPALGNGEFGLGMLVLWGRDKGL